MKIAVLKTFRSIANLCEVNILKKACFSLFAATIMAVALIGCDSGRKNLMIMSTERGRVDIELAGSGKITIDWGDGTVENHTLPKNVDGDYVTFTRIYNSRSYRTIKITGNNITKLNCDDNELISLDISKNSALIELICEENQLTSLDVSKNSALIVLICEENELSSLDVSQNSALKVLDCSENQLTGAALNALFETLHSNSGDKTIFIGMNPGEDDCNHSIATNKEWKVYYSRWLFEFP